MCVRVLRDVHIRLLPTNALGSSCPPSLPLLPLLAVQQQFWVFSLLGMAFIEYNTIMTAFETPSAVTGEGGLKEDYIPGDLGFDPLGLKPKTEAELDVMKTKELNNGRLAMIGIAGMLVQELINPANILG